MLLRLLANLTFATLAIALVAAADTPAKPASNGEGANASSSARLLGFSAWSYIPLLRNGTVPYHRAKDFHDTQFEYRWKSQWTVNRYVCTVEVRPTGDIDIGYKVPEITVQYSEPHGRGPLHMVHQYSAHDLSVGSGKAHAVLKPADCERIDLIYWIK